MENCSLQTFQVCATMEAAGEVSSDFEECMDGVEEDGEVEAAEEIARPIVAVRTGPAPQHQNLTGKCHCKSTCAQALNRAGTRGCPCRAQKVHCSNDCSCSKKCRNQVSCQN